MNGARDLGMNRTDVFVFGAQRHNGSANVPTGFDACQNQIGIDPEMNGRLPRLGSPGIDAAGTSDTTDGKSRRIASDGAMVNPPFGYSIWRHGR